MGLRISSYRFLPMQPVTLCWRCMARTSRRSRASVGSAISPRRASTATAAAAGSTRPPTCRRAASAAAGGLPPKRAGSISGVVVGCRCTSSASPPFTALVAAPSRRCTPAPRNASTSRARYSRGFMSRIWRMCSPPRSAGRGPEPSIMSATTIPPRPRPSSLSPRRCSACRRRRSCRSNPPSSLSMARSFYDDNKRVSNRLIKNELGLTLRYPDFRAGLAAILADEACPKTRHPASSD